MCGWFLVLRSTNGAVYEMSSRTRAEGFTAIQFTASGVKVNPVKAIP